MTKQRILLHKDYGDEDLYDLPRDVEEFMESREYHMLPNAHDGFKQGVFSVMIVWRDDQ